jgi:guanosine-3',5'-bis(diphosphate) 3'-pyrophosphohydrolase
MAKDIDDLIKKISTYSLDADLSVVKKAYETASVVHDGQKRLSGDPFISHPVVVANILADLQQDPVTIAAALLHDAIEDGGLSKEGIAKEFSAEISVLVEGVTKLGQLTYESKEVRQAENFRKMLLAMGEDIRIIIIKLADRLHNMQTLEHLSKQKQTENSYETREIFAPLAHRLGMWRIKGELEDLSFKFLEPDRYADTKERVAAKCSEREKYISDFISELRSVVDNLDIKSDIYGRAKHLYSIYKKMLDFNLEFDDIYDLIAVRVIVDTVKECYATLGSIHASWKPIPGRFRDYIAMPKSNGYQSLHTTVIGPQGSPVEIQIRTREMHKVAEYGVAAHWVYKEKRTPKSSDLKMAWLRQMLDWQTELKDAKDFMESFKIDLFADEVFVFTPRGEVLALPAGATPVDFAYRVHTEVGHRCMGSKVNGKIVPLNHKLMNGDIVEIVTSKSNNPKLDWLDFVSTPGARAKIKGWFRKQREDENVDTGRQALNQELLKMKIEPSDILSGDNLLSVVKEYGFGGPLEFYSAIGYGEVSAYQAAKKLRTGWQKEHGAPLVEEEMIHPKLSPKISKGNTSQGVKVSGLDNVMVRFSKCCRPLPGDDIVGFVTQGRGVSIHKKDCPNVTNLEPARAHLIPVEWVRDADVMYPIEIEVEAFDRVGVLKDILEKVVETKTNVSAANVKTKRGSSAFINLVVDVKDTEHLSVVTKSIRGVSDVYEVYRADKLRRSNGNR